MSMLLLIAVGGLGSAASAWGLSRTDRAARGGAIVGALALLGLTAMTVSMTAPVHDPGFGTEPFEWQLVPTSYLRLVIGLWGMEGAVLALAAWLLGGLPRLRFVLPPAIAVMTGAAVAFASADLASAVAAATGTGLAALLAIPPTGGVSAAMAAARELRVTIVAGVLLLIAGAVLPIAAGLLLRGTGLVDGASVPGGGQGLVSAAGGLVGLLTLAVVGGVGSRFGAIPFHLRVPRLIDTATPIAAPVLLAWLAIPTGVVGLAMADALIAPLALPLDGERWVIILAALLTLIAAALAAFIQDDLRHAAGYLVIADSGLVLAGLAALDPAAWGPTRIWLIVMAASKTALLAWTAVAEDRFGTRTIPDLRGWLRRSPILGAALAVTALATFGLPGWVGLQARGSLAGLAAPAPWDAILLVASFVTMPTYARLLMLGIGIPTSRVDRAAPERIIRRRRADVLAVEVEGEPGNAPVDAPGGDRPGDGGGRPASASASGPGDAAPPARQEAGLPEGRAASAQERMAATRERVTAARISFAGRRTRLAGRARTAWAASARAGARCSAALRRDRTELLAAAVLALAILAALTAWGALDVAGAAAEPAPISAGPGFD